MPFYYLNDNHEEIELKNLPSDLKHDLDCALSPTHESAADLIIEIAQVTGRTIIGKSESKPYYIQTSIPEAGEMLCVSRLGKDDGLPFKTLVYGPDLPDDWQPSVHLP